MVTELKCCVPECESVFKTSEPISPLATFKCRLHDVGKTLDFQDTQFDEDLRRGHKPVGTNHIPNQGSDVPVSNSGLYDESGVITTWFENDDEDPLP